MPQQTQTRRIEVRVDAQGAGDLKSITKGLADVNNSVRQSTSAVKSFERAFLAIQGLNFGGIGISSVVQLVDGLTKLESRLASVEGSASAGQAAFLKLVGAANATFTSVEDLGVIYNRLALSLKETGISTNDLIAFSTTLQNSFRLSGATASEANGAVIQLSQGLASGQVRGAELRAVLEANSIVGGLLAKQFGTTRGQLLKFAEAAGGLNASGVLKALANGAEDINKRAEALTPTIGEAATRAFNNLKVSVAAANKELGASDKIARAIVALSENIEPLSKSLIALGGAYLIYSRGANAAATATLFFQTAVSSSIVGAIVRAGIVIGGVVASIGAAPIALAALVASLGAALYQLEPVKRALESVGKGILSIFQAGYEEEQARLAKQYERTSKSLDRSSESTARYSIVQDQLSVAFRNQVNAMAEGREEIDSYTFQLAQAQKSAISLANFDYSKELAKLNREWLKDGDVKKYDAALKQIQKTQLLLDFQSEKSSLTRIDYEKKLKEIEQGKTKKEKSPLEKFREDVEALNREFANSKDIGEYQNRLGQLESKRLELEAGRGRISFLERDRQQREIDYRARLRQLNETGASIGEVNRVIDQNKLEELNAKLREGTIDVRSYNAEVIQLNDQFRGAEALSVGVQNYLQQVGSFSQGIAGVITNSFSTLENNFLEFIETGKFQFKDFANSVLKDLQRVLVRQLIVRSLSGLTTPIPAATSAGSGFQSDFGFGDYSIPTGFASGGVVKRTTPFGTTMGPAIAGEAGPEGILPLKRMSNGDLGVQAGQSQPNVYINIVNQSTAQVEQRETTNSQGDRVLELVILNTVKDGIASGKLDRQFSNSYGLNRRG